MKRKLYQTMIELTNGRGTSTVLQKIATSPLSRYLIPSYTKLYAINTQEVSKSLQQFSTLHEFFTRQLKEGARPIANDARAVVSPVDAKIESFGDITANHQFIVKGKSYRLTDLLGKEARAKAYENGKYIVFYLSPADYHRMHSPLDASVVRQYTLGGKSYPVNQAGLTYGKSPLSHNYRMVTQLQHGTMQCEFIKVGAMFVNSIALKNRSTQWHKGEEVGYFTFGSTVVMLFQKNDIAFEASVVQNRMIRVGEPFATML